MLYVGIPEGQMDEEDGIADLIFNVRQHVDMYLLQNQAAPCSLEGRTPSGQGWQQCPVLSGTCSSQVWCQDFDLPYLFLDIMYGYFKETVYKLKMTNKSAE